MATTAASKPPCANGSPPDPDQPNVIDPTLRPKVEMLRHATAVVHHLHAGLNRFGIR
jgi:hypothetical protein